MLFWRKIFARFCTDIAPVLAKKIIPETSLVLFFKQSSGWCPFF
jgi:hypothetical protein